MPTKHKRKRDDDKHHFDLPPTAKARSLPVIEPTKDFLAHHKKQKLEDGRVKRKKAKAIDDTPRTFARLMAWHKEGKRIGGGLDDGSSASKKVKMQRRQQADSTARAQETAGDKQSKSSDVPKIRPGETLAEYGIRVDQSLPLSSLAKTNINPNTTMPADLVEKEKRAKYLTKHNKRLMRMQSEWRNTEAKLRAKEEEEAEENEEKLEEEKLLWEGVKTTGKKGKKKALDDDPWKELEKKRRADEGRRKGESVGLSARDQVQAPPEFNVKMLNPFKERHNRQPDQR